MWEVVKRQIPVKKYLLFSVVQFYPLYSYCTLILLCPVYQEVPCIRQDFLGG